ncbi:MAG: hypothetical protein JNL90_00050 [Planctomycetes bacterium]|nr:hypothetical protein [Planctomycetota bacterium]
MAARWIGGFVVAWVPAGCKVPELAAPADLPAPLPDLAAPRAADAPPLPYDHYTGDGEIAGDYWMRVEEWRHPASGQSVVLLPMIHLADAAFYEAVSAKLRDADVVLTEGVGGPPSLSPTSLLLAYFFGNYSRGCWLGGLVPQDEGLDAGPRAERGDLDLAEYTASNSCGTSALHAVGLPALMALIEPIHLGRWLLADARTLCTWGWADEAAMRHFLVCDTNERHADDPEGDDETLLDGVITRRNAHLLDRLDEVRARPGVGRIALPWGANHLPGLAAGLAERGFERGDSEWVRAIGVRALLDDPSQELDGDRTHLYVPYLFDVKSYRQSWSCGLACDALFVGAGRESSEAALLWGFLARAESGPPRGESRFSLLPLLFERPLLFEWRRKGDSHRVRFLWFFEVGE